VRADARAARLPFMINMRQQRYTAAVPRATKTGNMARRPAKNGTQRRVRRVDERRRQQARGSSALRLCWRRRLKLPYALRITIDKESSAARAAPSPVGVAR